MTCAFSSRSAPTQLSGSFIDGDRSTRTLYLIESTP